MARKSSLPEWFQLHWPVVERCGWQAAVIYDAARSVAAARAKCSGTEPGAFTGPVSIDLLASMTGFRPHVVRDAVKALAEARFGTWTTVGKGLAV